MSQPVFLKLDQFEKQFVVGGSTIKALNGISFQLSKGEVLGLLGPNASGKSTLIKSMLSLVELDSGYFEIEGNKVDGKKYLKQVGAIIEGKKSINERLTSLENAKYYCTLKEVDFDLDYFNQLAAALNLSDVKKPVRFLSTGNKQKASIICSLIHKPSLFLLDEPTLGLDIECVNALGKLIIQLASDQQVTFIITSHDLHFIERVCNKLVCIESGKKTFDGNLEDFVNIDYKYKVKISEENALQAWLQERNYKVVKDINSWLCFVKDLDELHHIIKFVIDNKVDQNKVHVSSFDLEKQYAELLK